MENKKINTDIFMSLIFDKYDSTKNNPEIHYKQKKYMTKLKVFNTLQFIRKFLLNNENYKRDTEIMQYIKKNI